MSDINLDLELSSCGHFHIQSGTAANLKAQASQDVRD